MNKNFEKKDKIFFFNKGYIVKNSFISDYWIKKLNASINKLIKKSCLLKKSNKFFDLENNHTSKNPRLRRISYLDDLDPIFWKFCKNSKLPDIATSIFGPNIRFRECMINIKWSDGGSEVKWHQDIPFYPMTNSSVAQHLVLLKDVDIKQGPLKVLPGSHKKKLYDHYDKKDNWLGYIPEKQLKNLNLNKSVSLTGNAGTVTVHHCRTLHASQQNLSKQGRPVLIVSYASCDNFPYTPAAYVSSHYGEVVRGEEAKFARHEPGVLRLPPDWSDGYTSIFDYQSKKNIKP
jgi:hypothetical protein